VTACVAGAAAVRYLPKYDRSSSSGNTHGTFSHEINCIILTQEDFAYTVRANCERVNPLCGTLIKKGLNPIKLAYDRCCPDGRLSLTDLLVCWQFRYQAFYYTVLAFSSLRPPPLLSAHTCSEVARLRWPGWVAGLNTRQCSLPADY